MATTEQMLMGAAAQFIRNNTDAEDSRDSLHVLLATMLEAASKNGVSKPIVTGTPTRHIVVAYPQVEPQGEQRAAPSTDTASLKALLLRHGYSFPKRSTMAVLRVLMDEPIREWSPQRVSRITKTSAGAARSCLTRMAKSGAITKVGTDSYRAL